MPSVVALFSVDVDVDRPFVSDLYFAQRQYWQMKIRRRSTPEMKQQRARPVR